MARKLVPTFCYKQGAVRMHTEQINKTYSVCRGGIISIAQRKYVVNPFLLNFAGDSSTTADQRPLIKECSHHDSKSTLKSVSMDQVPFADDSIAPESHSSPPESARVFDTNRSYKF